MHPTDSSRTRLGDIESMLLKYQQNRTNRNMADTYNLRETRALVNRITEEYPKQDYEQSNWFNELKKGEWQAPIIDDVEEKN